MIPSTYLFLSLSVPTVIKRYGPGLIRSYLVACGILFNCILVLLLVWG